jgi:hypothetical protein
MVQSQNEISQRLGIVRVVYFHQRYPSGGPDNELLRLMVPIMEAVPVRCVAIYAVSGSGLWSQTVDLFLLLLSPFLRVRTRTISGKCDIHDVCNRQLCSIISFIRCPPRILFRKHVRSHVFGDIARFHSS